jgi:hypothetical protein
VAGRPYTFSNSAAIAYTSTTASPIMYASPGANSTLDIECIRVGTYSGSGVSYPSNGTLLFQLMRSTGTAAGGAADTPAPHNSGDVAAQGTFLDGSTAITGLTQGAVILWQQVLPFTAGANWAEWVTPGSEWRVAASGQVSLWVTASSAGTGTDLDCSLVFIM